MQLLSGDVYSRLTDGARELMRDHHGVKVLQTIDGKIVKLFRVKRWYSLSAIYPYSMRFMRNARRLQAAGIPTVDVEQVFYCHAIRRHGVVYPMLDGDSLQDLAREGGLNDELMQKLALFIARLHAEGIYFRSLHLGNVLLLPNGELGLIDIADMRFSSSPLRLDQRRRNFRHILRVPEHRELLQEYGLQRFADLYTRAANLSREQSERLIDTG